MTAPHFDPSAAARPDSGLFGLDDTLEDARVVIVPVPFDATTSYHRGAAGAPAAILAASHQVDLFDLETGRPYQAGIHMRPIDRQIVAWNNAARAAADPIIAAGGTDPGDARLCAAQRTVNDTSRWVQHWVRTEVEALLGVGKIVGTLGGDHSVPLGAIQAHARRFGSASPVASSTGIGPGPGFGILHIDAHADLRDAFEGFEQSHASIFRNVLDTTPEVHKLVQVGVRDVGEDEVDFIQQSRGRVRTFFDPELWEARHRGRTWFEMCDQIVAELPERVYVSFDIDGLDPALCPHTGTPVPGGLGFYEVTALLGKVVSSGRRIVGFDLTEVAAAPADDPDNDWDANVGARILYKLIGFALRSQGL